MTEDQRQQALENIALIKHMVYQTRQEMSLSGGGIIAYIWGIFCFVGFAGGRLFIPHGGAEGIWWTSLTIIGVLATALVIRNKAKGHSARERQQSLRWFFLFWIPLLVLAYTLCLFCVFMPGLSTQYITIFILLVISTGYLMLGLLLFKEMLFMGLAGLIGTILTAVFFLEYNDIILSLLFGTGLIITGLYIDRKWKK